MSQFIRAALRARSMKIAVSAAAATAISGMALADGWFGASTPAAAAPVAVAPAAGAAGVDTLAPLHKETEFDVVVVGGGIIGLATAREILKRFPHMKVAVLEKEREVGPHQSSHNSGVIHAGIYYEPGSVMARTCVRGAALMYDYCADHSIPHERSGKLIVAVDAEEDKVVQTLFERATKNGVQGLQVLSAAEVKAMEPHIVATSALWSPNTGIADFGAVCRSLAHEIVSTGKADIKVQFEVASAGLLPDGRVEIRGLEPGQKGPHKVVTAKHVITCGGLYADRLGKLFGGAEHPKVVAFRGTYYQMKPQYKHLVKTNVYPVPSGGGIPVGVHFTPTCNERRGYEMIIGPGACIAFSREGYKMSDIRLRDIADYALNGGLWRFTISNPTLSFGELWKDFNKAAFMKAAQKLMPTCTGDMVEQSFAGVMAQVFNADGKAAKDFIFERKVLGGTTLNVRNAPSPAATSSLAIAEHVVDIAQEDFAWAPPKMA